MAMFLSLGHSSSAERYDLPCILASQVASSYSVRQIVSFLSTDILPVWGSLLEEHTTLPVQAVEINHLVTTSSMPPTLGKERNGKRY
jgi:hypothetical protein